jgi:hypothetical protein
MSADSIDLTPSPRVLRMLGEIDFKAWQCLCEIIDNSIDAFAASEFVSGSDEKPTVKIRLPSPSWNQVDPSDLLTIEDNAEGMSYETLNKSLKAGFSGNNPVDKMGLFGMGFNISTARLGNRTEVITTTKESDEFLKVTIDFQELEGKGHFLAPVERIPKKADEAHKHGTKVTITKLRTDHIKALYQRKKITRKIGKIYGRIIREKEIKLSYDGHTCKPFNHCIWSKQRNGQAQAGAVPAVIEIDEVLGKRKYCSTCWVWLSDHDTECPSCNAVTGVTTRERRVKGWIGIQRYFHADHYGIDLIRNGRVITELDKSFFSWLNDDEDLELEYPVDGHQRLGRIVGELEIDFVKVTHQKDAFDKNTQDWRDVETLVRGDGPIRPKIAKSLGRTVNTSPLAKLFSAFRNAKAGIKNLVPQRNNGQAMITDHHIDDLVDRFYNGETDYQSDEKWWELVSEVNSNGGKESNDNPSGGDPFNGGDKGGSNTESEKESEPAADSTYEEDENSTQAEADVQLSQNYSIDLFKNVFIRVVAERRLDGKHENGFKVDLRGVELQFSYWPNAPIFVHNLLTPADFLINELAYHMHSIAQSEVSRIPITAVELALREKYFSDLYPTVFELQRQVMAFIEDLSGHLKSKTGDLHINLDAIEPSELALIKKKLTQNDNLNENQVKEALERGEFLSYASFGVLKTMILEDPQLVFDGEFFRKVWDKRSSSISLMEMQKKDLESFLDDIDWFNDNNLASGGSLWRGRVRRLVGSLEILVNWRS